MDPRDAEGAAEERLEREELERADDEGMIKLPPAVDVEDAAEVALPVPGAPEEP